MELIITDDESNEYVLH